MIIIITHIIPVGFEEDRAVHGLIQLGAHLIYLLIDEKNDNWGKEARSHTLKVKNRLKAMTFNEKNIIEIGFDPTSFESCSSVIKKILEKEKETKEIYLNISSSTKLCAVAFTLESLNYENTYLYYVVPAEYNIPKGGGPFSYGAKRIEIFSPREYKFSEMMNTILKILKNNKVNSLEELNKLVYPQDISKANQAKISYYVRKLEKEGFVSFKRNEEIVLTELGRSKFTSLKDDAKIVKV